jgi:hypothetical protein
MCGLCIVFFTSLFSSQYIRLSFHPNPYQYNRFLSCSYYNYVHNVPVNITEISQEGLFPGGVTSGIEIFY